MLNREDIKGIRTRLEEFLYWSESAGPYGNDIRALFTPVEELEERCKRLEKINDTAMEANTTVIAAGKQMRPRIEELEASNLELEERLRKAGEALKVAKKEFDSSGIAECRDNELIKIKVDEALAELSPSA